MYGALRVAIVMCVIVAGCFAEECVEAPREGFCAFPSSGSFTYLIPNSSFEMCTQVNNNDMKLRRLTEPIVEDSMKVSTACLTAIANLQCSLYCNPCGRSKGMCNRLCVDYSTACADHFCASSDRYDPDEDVNQDKIDDELTSDPTFHARKYGCLVPIPDLCLDTNEECFWLNATIPSY